MDLLQFLNKCINCNIYDKKEKNERCTSCFFKIGSDGAETSKILYNTLYKIPIGIPKPKLFYFLYYPELNFSFPTLPNVDLFGNEKYNRKKWNWVIHHEDGNHYNDNIWNLILLLNIEHHIIHSKERNPMDNVNKSIFKQTIRNKYKQRYNQQKYLDKNKNKYYDMLTWLDSLIPGKYVINKEISEKLNYHENYNLKYGIDSAIKNNEINNISLVDNGSKGKHKRWIIIKK